MYLSLFISKAAALRPVFLFEKRLGYSRFPVYFVQNKFGKFAYNTRCQTLCNRGIGSCQDTSIIAPENLRNMPRKNILFLRMKISILMILRGKNCVLLKSAQAFIDIET